MSSSGLSTTILENAAERVRRICNADWCAVGLLRGSEDVRVERWVASPRAAAEGLAREAADPRLVVVLRRGGAYRSTRPGGPFPGPEARVAGTAATLALPIAGPGRLEGLVCVGRRREKPFTGRDEMVLTSLAEEAARAFADARLLEDAARRRDEAEELAQPLHAQVTEAALARERIRISNELHDTLSQLAFSVGLKLDWCLDRVGRTSALRPKLEDIRRAAGDMMERVRQLIGHLADGPEPATLSGRLERLAEDFRELTGARLDLVIAGDPARLARSSEEAMRKTLQEALVNVAKHASASHILMRVEIAAGEASFEVTDDGVGMSDALTGGLPGHFGLRQMRERLEIIGGRIVIRTLPGAGVSVRGAVPLEPPGREARSSRPGADGASRPRQT